MEVFAVRYVEAIANDQLPVRYGDLAEKAGITGQTVSDWRHHTPGFNEWLGTLLARYVSHQWPAVKAVAVRMALRGSIEHMKFLRELMEPSKGPALPPGAPPGSTSPLFGAVIVNLPLPPAELEGHPTVRAMLETATIDVTPVSA